MPAGLILEFRGVGESECHAVNAVLGIDMRSGTGNWPTGLRAMLLERPTTVVP
jgi:hypothetical protein